MKTARRLFSLALVLVMVLSLSVTAFATSDDPTVTVYVTSGMYTEGGFDPDHGFIDQSLSPADPASKLVKSDFFTGYDGENYWYDELTLADSLATTQAVYAPESYTSTTVTVLDAIIFALQFNGYTCTGGWDFVTQPNGGYVHSVSQKWKEPVRLQKRPLIMLNTINIPAWDGVSQLRMLAKLSSIL